MVECCEIGAGGAWYERTISVRIAIVPPLHGVNGVDLLMGGNVLNSPCVMLSGKDRIV